MRRKTFLTLLCIVYLCLFLSIHGWQLIILMPLAFATPKDPNSQIVGWLKQYARYRLMALNLFYNTAIGGRPGQTITGRTDLRRNEWPFNLIAWFLEKIHPGHFDKRPHPSEFEEEVL